MCRGGRIDAYQYIRGVYMIIIALVILILIIALAKPRSKNVSPPPPKKEYKTCPVCGKILLSGTDFCPECGLDVRPISSYMHPHTPKRLGFCVIFAIIFLCVFLTCLAFGFDLFSYSEYNTLSVVIFDIVFFGSLLLSIALFSYTIETQRKVDKDYADACKAEEERRLDIVRRMVHEREEKARIEEEEKQKRLEEEARKVAEEKRRLLEEEARKAEEKAAKVRKLLEESKKLIEERDNRIKEHYESVSKQSEYLRGIHDNLYRVPVSVNPHPTNIGISPVIPTIVPFSDTTKQDMSDYVSIDIETTGFNPPPKGKDGIAQIAAVRFVDSVPVAAFITKINPGVPIPIDATRVNGLTDSMLADAPRIENVLDSFSLFIGDSPIVGFKLEFDLSFLAGYGFLDSRIKRKYISIDRDMRQYFDTSGNLETMGKDYGFYCTFHREAYDALAIGYLCSLCYLKRYDLPQSEFPSVFYKYDKILES